jgi:dihydrolipoamide dehydrogenase
MQPSIDVAVIGAGHAGLNAIKEIRQTTDNWVLINGGPLGTTCARIGCMPSKIALQLAETYQGRERFSRFGVDGGDQLVLDQHKALEHVRALRDTFVDLVLANTTDEMDATQLIEGYAEFIDRGRLRVGDREIHARAIIIATGARSVIPPALAREFGDRIGRGHRLGPDRYRDRPDAAAPRRRGDRLRPRRARLADQRSGGQPDRHRDPPP